MPQSDVARAGSPVVAFPRPRFLAKVHHSVHHDVFVHLERHEDDVYNGHEEGVEQEGREHASLTKALFYSTLPEHTPSLSRTHARMPS